MSTSFQCSTSGLLLIRLAEIDYELLPSGSSYYCVLRVNDQVFYFYYYYYFLFCFSFFF